MNTTRISRLAQSWNFPVPDNYQSDNYQFVSVSMQGAPQGAQAFPNSDGDPTAVRSGLVKWSPIKRIVPAKTVII